MSRDVVGKLAAGEELDEDDVAFARDRGISLPEEYGVDDTISELDDTSRPPSPVTQSGPMPSEDKENLSDMTKAELRELAESQNIEVTKAMSKDELLEILEDHGIE